MSEITGYNADGDTFCPDCADTRYGVKIDPMARDSASEMVVPIHDDDEGDLTGEFCTDCGSTVLPPRS